MKCFGAITNILNDNYTKNADMLYTQIIAVGISYREGFSNSIVF